MDIRNNEGLTPYGCARMHRHMPIVELLDEPPESPRVAPRRSIKALRATKVDPRSLEEAFSTGLVARSRSKRAPKSDFARSWVDLGSLEGQFWCFFDALSTEQAASLAESASYENPAKTFGFYTTTLGFHRI